MPFNDKDYHARREREHRALADGRDDGKSEAGPYR